MTGDFHRGDIFRWTGQISMDRSHFCPFSHPRCCRGAIPYMYILLLWSLMLAIFFARGWSSKH